jgi:hypothetical protein
MPALEACELARHRSDTAPCSCSLLPCTWQCCLRLLRHHKPQQALAAHEGASPAAQAPVLGTAM